MSDSNIDDNDLLRLVMLLLFGAAAGVNAMGGGAALGTGAEAWATRWDHLCSVQEVVTGDQLLCNDSTAVRLIGIDAPGPAYGAIGDQAARALASVAGVGAVLRLELDESPDDVHGRVWAYAYLSDGRLLNALLTEAGYARAEPHPPNLLHQEAIDAAETTARLEGRGLWEDPSFTCFAQNGSPERCAR